MHHKPVHVHTVHTAKTDGYEKKNRCLPEHVRFGGRVLLSIFSFYIALSRGKQSRLFEFI